MGSDDSGSWLYRYPPLLGGTLVKRYKRFFADIELDSGEIVTAHCPNTGPMTGICLPGNRVMLSQSDNPNRKLAYTWEMIELTQPELMSREISSDRSVWVGVNTGLPNKVAGLLLQQKVIPALSHYQQIRAEVPYGQEKSRIDFLLDPGLDSVAIPDPRPIYVEVKNTTWTSGSLALFPDTVTTRGQKHLRELMSLMPTARAVMLYFINRGDCDRFSPGDEKDPTYGKLLRQAIDRGLEVYPCRFQVSPAGLQYLGLASLEI
ncbi:MAG: DNA/RNA nuclease SfsA [Synechococcales bacterium]|nr:DNA/RNA nuclease SfsA [Synechococcales bacterium]